MLGVSMVWAATQW
uniref:Uncharacterized protein n=1 Tax=Arundo donax TaxID=35708 RepID=A0A0A8XTJ9_ARUDO